MIVLVYDMLVANCQIYFSFDFRNTEDTPGLGSEDIGTNCVFRLELSIGKILPRRIIPMGGIHKKAPLEIAFKSQDRPIFDLQHAFRALAKRLCSTT